MNVLKKEAIIPRIDGILKDLDKLREIQNKGGENLKTDEDAYALCQFYLRQALEGVFHIGEHILSRLNGGRATEYKEIAKKLGEAGIVDQKFAQTKLTAMAGYRNRLTHFYAEITPDELFEILEKDLPDFEIFLSAIKDLLSNPGKYNLTIE
ncbi:MAG: hypothetical protein UY21_C0002G0011 [Microgenomates group bacterium GW2011_GWA1_48_10]|uniref:DUF86 domain-containing protein n=1 Tax=Candidatus Gottesmanbacteria bacterium RIFCSPHIGHO2_01_FULL_47_48 TaxID=1798381 RepID=A0A1F5ZZD7_9BACT|nr:MAG: hypothetical protein UY21_C0002G0011 [Microgenomates group bacterium GW2011_GWA1_48_10]OGG17820.1 MAG: hypothetical protein A2721_02245 [Candidatus Gottesmanbacteria bacterium RIFCSPHIGHO2_01_FULL_47_48]